MKIFPKEILENTIQYYIPKYTVRSLFIYGIVLTLCIAGVCSLPFIKVDIFSSARGYIKPNHERVSVTTASSGKVIYLNIHNNSNVVKGDTLLILQDNNLEEQMHLLRKQKGNLLKEQTDLDYLIGNRKLTVKELLTPKFQKQLIEFQAGLNEHSTKLKKLKTDFERNKKLFEKGVIARVEYEQIKLEYDLAENLLYQYKKRRLNSWQATLTELEATLLELDSDSKQISKNRENFIITAAIDGTLINILGIGEGSFITAGTTLAEITPNTDLVAECYLSTRDIGLIDPNKKVTFQIDAFNYNQWGLASGKIISIGKDVEFVDKQPFYRVRCRLDQRFLELKNGYKGILGKGMTLNARFELTERTLYQLLYDKVDDWLHPGNAQNLVLNE